VKTPNAEKKKILTDHTGVKSEQDIKF